MAVVNQAVQDGIRKCWLAEIGMPFVHGQLATEHGRAHVQTIVEDFEQVGTVLRTQGDQSPVIQDQDGCLGEALEQFQVASVAVGGADFLEEARHAPVPALQALAACLMRERTRDPCLPRPGRTSNIVPNRTYSM